MSKVEFSPVASLWSGRCYLSSELLTRVMLSGVWDMEYLSILSGYPLRLVWVWYVCLKQWFTWGVCKPMKATRPAVIRPTVSGTVGSYTGQFLLLIFGLGSLGSLNSWAATWPVGMSVINGSQESMCPQSGLYPLWDEGKIEKFTKGGRKLVKGPNM